jgi:hypothetical protein
MHLLTIYPEPELVTESPHPARLWEMAAGDRGRYTQLLIEHGYLSPQQPLPDAWVPRPRSVPEETDRTGRSGCRLSLAPADVLVYRVASFSGNGIYDVWHLPDGRWICPCADFEYRGHDRPCKHILIAMERERNHVQ